MRGITSLNRGRYLPTSAFLRTMVVAGLGAMLLTLSAQAEEACAIAKNAMADAAKIRGLKARKGVPCLVHDRDEVERFLQTTIRTKLPKDKLEQEGVVYKAAGLLPDGFDYPKGVIELYLGQIGGYYDPAEDRFIMAAWMPSMLQVPVAVHELTHALQDQHFNLDSIIDPKMENGDELLARSALVEGDATAVMHDYARRKLGLGSLSKDKDVESLVLQQVMSTGTAPGKEGPPESLKMLLLFPYTSGLRFAHALLRRGGYKAIDDAFRKLPRSTEEVLHIDKYFEQQPDFRSFERSDLINASFGTEGKNPIYVDTLGEFAISVVLQNLGIVGEAASKAAAGWGGDLIGIFDRPEEKLVAWIVNWDTSADADDFVATYLGGLKKRYELSKSIEPGVWAELGPSKRLRLMREGTVVRVAVGIQE